MKASRKHRLLVLLLGVTMSTSAPAEYHNQNEKKGSPDIGFFGTLSLIKKVFFDGSNRVPTEKLPEVKPDFLSFLKRSEHMKFIWFGHSTLLLNVDDHIILIDPVFYNASPVEFMVKRFQPPVVPVKDIPFVDTIVISHDHYDHLDKQTIAFYKDKPTRFLVPTGVGQHLLDWGIEKARITELSWHESVTVKAVTFRAAPAQHFSGRGFFDRNETLWASWIIEGKADKVYYSGDSGYGPHFKEIGEKYGPFDYAFLENGQYNDRWPDVHMRPEETLQALFDLHAETLIPVHWGMFDLSLHHWTEPVVRTHTIAKNWEIPIITPRLGETVDFFHHPDDPWWGPFVPAKKTEKEIHEAAFSLPAVYPESASPR